MSDRIDLAALVKRGLAQPRNVHAACDRGMAEQSGLIAQLREQNARLEAVNRDLIAVIQRAVIDDLCFCADRVECGGSGPCWQCRARAAIAKARQA